MIKRQRYRIGAIVKIPLTDGFHTYGRLLDSGMAFYNIHTRRDCTISEIVQMPILFVTGVYKDVITKKVWKIIGKKFPLENQLLEAQERPVYTEDILTGNWTIHYVDGSQKMTSSPEEIHGLESATVWTAESIEKRLNDHFAKRKNPEVEIMQKGRPMTAMLEYARKLKKAS